MAYQYNRSYIFGRKKRSWWKKIATLAGTALAILILLLQVFFFRAPAQFPKGMVIPIASGSGLNQISKSLSDARLIRSQFFFKAFVVLLGGSKHIVAGDYYFGGAESSWRVAWRLGRGEREIAVVRVTIPEGTTAKGIAALMPKELTHFSSAEFIKLAAGKEGYLFPDTYFFDSGATAAVVLKTLQTNFTDQTAAIKKEAAAAKKNFADVVKVASIIEAETAGDTNRRTVADIIWKRLALGMPLQVDATLHYATGKTSAQLTQADLKSSSLFNTYVHTGLPPTPISNPGLEALEAAVNPAMTKYFYFLSDKSGTMHYASTFEQHVANVQKYID